MPLISISCVALILSVLFPTGFLLAAPPVILEPGRDSYGLSLHLDLLEDKNKEWTFAQVASPEFASRFMPNRKPLLNFGFTRSAYWLRCQIDNQTSPGSDWLLELDYMVMSRLDLYVVHADGSITAKRSGTLSPPKAMEVDFPGFLFHLTIRPEEKQTIYLRLATDGIMRVPLILWTPRAFDRHFLNKRQLQCLALGVLLSLVVYNIFVFFILREKNAIYYILTICFAILYSLCLTGLAAWLLGPDHIRWSFWGLHVGGQMAMVFLIKFSQQALKTKIVAPLIHKVLNGVMVFNIATALLTFFNYYLANIIAYVFPFIGSCLLAYVGFRCWIQGHKGVRYYVVSWIMILAVVLVHVLGGSGLLPVSPFNSSVWMFVSVLAASMLSLVLTDKYRTVKEENQRTLEEKVSERTRKLNQAVDELNYRVTFEQMVAAISTDFMSSSLSPKDVGREIKKALSIIGWFCVADQSYAVIMESRWAGVKQVYQWSRTGVAIPGLFEDDLSVADDFSWLRDKLRHQDSVIKIQRMDPETTLKEEALYRRLAAGSLLIVPLVYHEELLGLVGLGSDQDGHSWSENDEAFLKIVGQIITNALVHKRSAEELTMRNLLLTKQQEVSPGGILVVDEHGKFISYNQRFLDLWGISEDIIASNRIRQVIRSLIAKMKDTKIF
ncbi:MAG: GAF domain-containing protein, partial [Deltaproteobacteria bacterium]|nr:GAF domain-containing protein [Deltaproteobacteria bacterium]